MFKQQTQLEKSVSTVQNANCVVMVPPKEFAFNAETARDNEFQHQVNETTEQVRKQAMQEFNTMVGQLRQAGVQVVEFDYPLGEVETPDAVFPNNWFSTTADGALYTFPMACENRQQEVRPDALREALEAAGRKVVSEDSLTDYLAQNAHLESTGVMVIDHVNRTIYAALSQRCDREVLEDYAERIGYDRVVSFQTALPSGKPIYHTNVMMAIGERFCVICDEVIPEFERRFVLKSLAKDKQVISISLEQMNQFCGNILELETVNGDKVIAMSQSAYDAFSSAQRAQLASHGKLLPFNVQTIESIGGGSVRCMLGEVFLPSRQTLL
ncbi:arginine deiminase-related protein [Vibrio sp. Isolate25]|uniref:arginine deiminase-related protein n=1 Tax=Vibrio TaxID=662 RepID=UPI001EFEB10F|nr:MULTISPECIES: arginine deiminase-related protein [Vibrio]MCG9595230.1 arginine deiminase-related protein [Vibrio sp. Isolate25]MCG9677742.1 arginine deiminase-related protein [Vibrio sp. Isolate24]MCG9681510.1 arginine deiminase-related protein [Vibrio sp. Isolate23]USD34598.1 amidinotransferase [Vibrio sp. SCSIO 43186]USD48514.1 amidinotransferase [Vibrio sp. SCSIO 43145]